MRGERSSRSKAGAFAEHNLAQKKTKRASCPFRVSAPNSQRAFVSALQRLARASWQQSSGPNMADAKLALAVAAPVATPCRAPLAALQAPIWQCIHASAERRREELEAEAAAAALKRSKRKSEEFTQASPQGQVWPRQAERCRRVDRRGDGVAAGCRDGVAAACRLASRSRRPGYSLSRLWIFLVQVLAASDTSLAR